MRELTDEGRTFLEDYHLATLSTMAPWGGIHVVAVGFTLGADGVVRIITNAGSQKVRNILRDPTATVAQVEKARWLSIQGIASVHDDPDEVATAVDLYSRRYRPPRPNPERVALHIRPTRILASAGLLV
ncbi:TIGR03618 family F420-dependent PPOX class oxidoreductase [Cnuibacter physcomitrellae]|uniref:TIGR03618 family F420-dependent PPOX class oxidoreductase n=1 Tax=Cnuibacter physcomitrellae TaxID=1619308 RepID=UPI002175EE8E|nr:TIGR03618 family F420-dependent PPOX class oxidoreductase [Cnuibacter physcomitrellae]MCS5497467.1 TIGR03618 family F420-dependent PPOX class oxidoreductase [Cnuibacter physcomitrellae]